MLEGRLSLLAVDAIGMGRFNNFLTFVAESHAAPRRVRSRTTSMAWLRLRAVVIVGTLMEMSDGLRKDVDVIDAPETWSLATEVDFMVDRMSEGEALGSPSS